VASEATAPPGLSVVVPVYGNEATLPAVLEQMAALAGAIAGELEVVFVVDGSPDNSLLLLRQRLLEPHPFRSQLVALSRNFGAFSAIRVGLEAAESEIVTVVAADLQEPLSLTVAFYEALASGEHDVAVGVREQRDDPWTSRTTASIFWRLYRRLVQREMPVRGLDVFACTRQVVAQLLRLEESHTSLVGLLLWVGFRRVEIPYDRIARAEGKSGWSVRKKLRYLLDSAYSFSDLPVHLITGIGIVGVLGSTIIGLVVFVAWLTGSIGVAGYTPMILALVFTGSSTLLSLGVIGSYVWRTYENTKGRPGAITMGVDRFPADSDR